MLPVNLAKIIEYLVRNNPNRFNVNQIARNLKISVGSAYKILKSLEKKQILISERIGNGIYYSLNLKNKEVENIAELVLIESRNKALAKNPHAAVYAKGLPKEILEGKLVLKLHPEKTKVVHAYYDGFEFLGCLFKSGYIRPKDQGIDSFKDKVRYITKRQQPRNLKMVINRLNPVIRGWGNYFRYGNVKTRYLALDEWIRMRLRSFLEKKKAVVHQNQRIYTRTLKSQGLTSLYELLPGPFPAMGQLGRKAVYGKSVRTV